MARKDSLLLYGIFGAIGYVLWQMLRKPSTGSAPATHPSGTAGGAVPGSPNQVLNPAPTDADYLTAWMKANPGAGAV